MGVPALVGDGVVGGHHQTDRGDFAAAAAAAVAAGGRVVIVAVEQEALDLAAVFKRVGDEALGRVRRLGEEVETLLQVGQQGGVLFVLLERGGAADVDALQTAGALPRIDGDVVEAAAARDGLLHGVEEGPRARHREAGEQLDELGEVGEQRRLTGVELAGSIGDELVEGACFLALTVGFAHAFGDQIDVAAHGFALSFGDFELADAGEQEFVDLMHAVGDRGVRTDQRTFHAAGTEVGVEHRHAAAEEALVLRAGGAGGHEQASAGQDRGFGDGAFAEGRGDHVAVVLAVEQAAAGRGAVGLAHRGRERNVAQHDRRRLGVDLGEGGLLVVDALGGVHALADHRHVAFDDGAALAAELLADLLAHLLEQYLLAGALGDAVDAPGDGADEGDAHHPRLQLGDRRVPLGDGEGVDDVEVDLLLADRLARLYRQFGPGFFGRQARLQDEGAARGEALKLVGVAEGAVVGRDDDFDVLKLGVGDLDRLGAEGDVEVGRRAALFGAVLRRRLGVHVEHAGEDVGEQLARGDGAVAADRVEADAEGIVGQEARVGFGLERHQLGFGVGRLHPRLQFGHARGRVLGEELRAEVDQRAALAGLHVLERSDQVARLQVVAAEAEDRRGQARRGFQRRDAGVAFAVGVLAGAEDRLGDEVGERGLVGALEHGDRLLAFDGGDQFGFGEGLQQLDGDEADLLALAAQVVDDGFDVVADRAQADHDVVGVLALIGVHRIVAAAGEAGVLVHRAAHEGRDFTDEVGAVVDRAGLEVRLVLHRAGEAGVVDVDLRRDELAGALLEGVHPLALPLRMQFGRQPGNGLLDEVAGVVLLDLGGVLFQILLERGEVVLGDFAGVAGEVLVQLEDAALGAEEDFLRQRRGHDAPGRVAEVFAQQLGFGQLGFAHHVARREAVHGVGHRDQRQRGAAVGDRREVGGFLRVGAEEHGVARAEQGIDVVMAGHDVERVLGDDARRDLQHKAAGLLAHRHVMRFEGVENALAGGGVGDELAAGERRAEGAALGRVFAFRFEEERVLAPHVDAAFGTEGFVDFGDFRRRGDRVSDDAAADVTHDMCNRAVAMDDGRNAGVLRCFRFHDGCSEKCGMNKLQDDRFTLLVLKPGSERLPRHFLGLGPAVSPWRASFRDISWFVLWG